MVCLRSTGDGGADDQPVKMASVNRQVGNVNQR